MRNDCLRSVSPRLHFMTEISNFVRVAYDETPIGPYGFSSWNAPDLLAWVEEQQEQSTVAAAGGASDSHEEL